tara:strand:- start:42 stop:236 length:195 start_codon:yes stop_codon:yes gene_type:complete
VGRPYDFLFSTDNARIVLIKLQVSIADHSFGWDVIVKVRFDHTIDIGMQGYADGSYDHGDGNSK